MTRFTQRFAEFNIRHRIPVVVLIAIATAALGIAAAGIEVRTIFRDLLPQNHEYVRTHEAYKDTFGGSNMVSIMLEVENGDIFRLGVLEKIRQLTNDLQRVEGVNQFQIISLASKKLKEVRASTAGIESRPIMWPDLPRNDQELANLRQAVLDNPLVYGAYVSRDLKSALVTVDFIDRLVNYETAFGQIRELVARVDGDGVRASVVGDPILYGWVRYYLPETVLISGLTITALVALLFLFARTWRGTLLPLLAGLVSSIWALGIGRLLGFNFDPLIIVVAFLITARSISHSVQLVTRFDDIVAAGDRVTSRDAARMSMAELFRPGMLGVIADAGAILVVILTPIPLLQKVAIIGAIWVGTIAIAAVVLTPVLLSWIERPRRYAHPLDVGRYLHVVLDKCVAVVIGRRTRHTVLMVTAVIFVASGLYTFNLEVGDAQPGSPILWSDSKYNRDSAAINKTFQGADRMFVVLKGDAPDALKEPQVLESMSAFKRHMTAQPEVGGALSIADILSTINRVLHEGNPRYQELGRNKLENGELMYLYVSGSEPGDLDRFSDARYQDGAVTLFFRDHRGATVRTAIARIKDFIRDNPLEHASYRLAGGLVGVLAAVNEVILAGQVEAIALALLVVVICCTVVYRSSAAGMFFMVPILLANTITFAYMAAAGIGMNINTVPVVALGIGLGVDYAFYIVDGIKEEVARGASAIDAITKSLHSAGRGVLVTGGTLVASVMLWMFSSLRFQAEMGLLIALWLFVSASCALVVMPALAYVLKPKFIFGEAGTTTSSNTLVNQGMKTVPKLGSAA
jgi:uncharacterized protein